ncbi:uncharacterized protein LOC126772030 [Nymphalis io]|uniref:uncharacterized protein LOC126772030 n=1 Tax=Inachis io TaxID=171585 RepID=UPI0021698FEE|nr:uncharacterized protein LOC126772030 [Nymphalis io]
MKLTLGKFGLKHCDLPTMFSNVAFLMRLITININQLYAKSLEPMLESPNYEIANFVTILAIGLVVYILGSVVVYIIIIVGYNEAQLYALSEELINVWDDGQIFYQHIKNRITADKVHAINIKNRIINEYVRMSLENITKFHITNISLVRELDSNMRTTLVIEYSCKVVSIIAGLLGGIENTFLQLPYTIIQIFMDCLSGQRLIDACDQFRESVYACKWENFNASNQRTVFLMLMMSQKTLTLSAGGMVKLDFICFMNIIKSTYSIYTTLKSAV